MNLQEIVTKRTGKAISQCSNKELYFSLLEMTKGMAESSEETSDQSRQGVGQDQQREEKCKYRRSESKEQYKSPAGTGRRLHGRRRNRRIIRKGGIRWTSL